MREQMLTTSPGTEGGLRAMIGFEKLRGIHALGVVIVDRRSKSGGV
jgi:hypothetical protein